MKRMAKTKTVKKRKKKSDRDVQRNECRVSYVHGVQ